MQKFFGQYPGLSTFSKYTHFTSTKPIKSDNNKENGCSSYNLRPNRSIQSCVKVIQGTVGLIIIPLLFKDKNWTEAFRKGLIRSGWCLCKLESRFRGSLTLIKAPSVTKITLTLVIHYGLIFLLQTSLPSWHAAHIFNHNRSGTWDVLCRWRWKRIWWRRLKKNTGVKVTRMQLFY